MSKRISLSHPALKKLIQVHADDVDAYLERGFKRVETSKPTRSKKPGRPRRSETEE